MRKTFITLIFIITPIILLSQNLTIGSYNIRLYSKTDIQKGDGWERRSPAVINLIEFHDFDIWGAQEVVHNQLMDITNNLPTYEYIGVGRDDGKTKGEYSPIFYKKDRFKLIKSGHFWISEETDYPNRGWDAALPRICTWGYFQDKKTKKKIWFFNLHMDHRGVLARKEGAKLVLAKVKEMCKKEPVILTGDFNVDQTNESYTLIRDSEILKDSYEAAKIKYALNGTFNGFNPNFMTDSRIDHIFVSPSFKVKKYGILTDSYRAPKNLEEQTIQAENFPNEVSFKDYEARMPSDHFPILVTLEY